LLMLPFSLLEAIAARLEGEIEHGLTMILNVLAPEMQPVFASHGKSGGSHTSTIEQSHSASAGTELKTESSAQGKGHHEEPAVNERLDAVPDEEEII
jgi:hypothetical protein